MIARLREGKLCTNKIYKMCFKISPMADRLSLTNVQACMYLCKNKICFRRTDLKMKSLKLLPKRDLSRDLQELVKWHKVNQPQESQNTIHFCLRILSEEAFLKLQQVNEGHNSAHYLKTLNSQQVFSIH